MEVVSRLSELNTRGWVVEGVMLVDKGMLVADVNVK